MQHRRLVGVAIAVVGLVGMGADWDSSVRIGDGETHDRRISALNGTIKIGNSARTGDCNSVNGSITIGMNSQVGDINAVNGNVEIGSGTAVDGDVSTVNGGIALDDRVTADEVESVNGRISLRGAEVARDVTTINGDIRITDGAIVGGNVVVKDRGRNSSDRRRPLRIEISGGAVVRGSVINEDEGGTDVELILRDGGRVEGSIEGVKVLDK